MKADRVTLGPVLFVLEQLYVNHVAGHRTFDKNYFAIHLRQGFALSRIIVDLYPYQYYIFPFSHGAKLKFQKFKMFERSTSWLQRFVGLLHLSIN